MSSSEDRQARALEGILGQLTFINQLLRKMVEVKDLPGSVTDTWRPLMTESGRQVGWLFPGEDATVADQLSTLISEVLKQNDMATALHEKPGLVLLAQRVWSKPDGSFGYRGVALDTVANAQRSVNGSFTELEPGKWPF